MKNDDLNILFNMLLEETNNIFNNFNKDIEKYSKLKDYDKVNEINDKISKLANFCNKIKELQNEWNKLFVDENFKIRENIKGKKLKRGLKTSDKKYIIPILESLIELGGKGEMSKVLDKVHEKMKNILNEYDYEDLPSGNSIRWINTAQWCRFQLIQKNLLSRDSPIGIWEITKEGIEYYNKNKLKQI